MRRWWAVVGLVVVMTASASAHAAVAEPSEPDGPARAVAARAAQALRRPAAATRTPERPSTVLKAQKAPTSLDRSLAVGLQASPAGNRVVGSVIAAGGVDAVHEATLAAVASVADRSTSRGGGADRYGTAVGLSAQHFLTGTTDVWLATGETFPDGLAASAIAGARGGPVL